MTPDTTRPTSEHLRTGELGEALARRYLEQAKGLVVLDRNWRCPDGELDLVLTDGRRLIACEVKTRTSTAYGTPGEAVDDAKADRVRRLTRRWLLEHGVRYPETRYDVVAILWPRDETPRITHLQGVL